MREGVPGPSAAERRRLVASARLVRRRAHAPYSGFAVGAAVMDDRGRIHAGCNVENASFGLTVCAERNAVAAAVAAGARRLRAVAVVSEAPTPSPPCGACRQVLAEFCDAGTAVLLAASRGGPPEMLRLGQLLPRTFRLDRPTSPRRPSRPHRAAAP